MGKILSGEGSARWLAGLMELLSLWLWHAVGQIMVFLYVFEFVLVTDDNETLRG
jgi:hypothetical protein